MFNVSMGESIILFFFLIRGWSPSIVNSFMDRKAWKIAFWCVFQLATDQAQGYDIIATGGAPFTVNADGYVQLNSAVLDFETTPQYTMTVCSFTFFFMAIKVHFDLLCISSMPHANNFSECVMKKFECLTITLAWSRLKCRHPDIPQCSVIFFESWFPPCNVSFSIAWNE